MSVARRQKSSVRTASYVANVSRRRYWVLRMSKKELEIKKMGNILIADGELYEPIYVAHERNDEIIRFRRISKRRFEFLKKQITAKLQGRLKSKDILENALNDMQMKGLERINKELCKPKPKVRREHGCFDLVIGKGKNSTTIPIR
jgi:hypothetical protein